MYGSDDDCRWLDPSALFTAGVAFFAFTAAVMAWHHHRTSWYVEYELEQQQQRRQRGYNNDYICTWGPLPALWWLKYLVMTFSVVLLIKHDCRDDITRPYIFSLLWLYVLYVAFHKFWIAAFFDFAAPSVALVLLLLDLGLGIGYVALLGVVLQQNPLHAEAAADYTAALVLFALVLIFQLVALHWNWQWMRREAEIPGLRKRYKQRQQQKLALLAASSHEAALAQLAASSSSSSSREAARAAGGGGGGKSQRGRAKHGKGAASDAPEQGIELSDIAVADADSPGGGGGGRYPRSHRVRASERPAGPSPF